jgi:hypothetical protein
LKNWSNRHHIQLEHAVLVSRLEDDFMSSDVFYLTTYYANLALASGENLLEMAKGSRSPKHEHLILQSIIYCLNQTVGQFFIQTWSCNGVVKVFLPW